MAQSRLRKNKYKNSKTIIDGFNFASKSEAQYYVDLKALKAAGKIESFELQPKYELIPPYVNAAGKKIRGMYYVADFLVRDLDGKEHIIDVKGSVGFQTETFKLKAKLFSWIYKDKVIEIVTVKVNGKK